MDQLIISNVSKTYANGVKALDRISLRISKGMFGLLGPNGAGKSSFMRTLVGLQTPDEGAIHWGKLDLLKHKVALRKKLGYLPQAFGLYPETTAEKLLSHLAILKGIADPKLRHARVTALLHQTNLYADRKKRLKNFSGGMKQRFGIAQALLAQPQLLIVDEPTAGLDPSERNRFYNLLSELGETAIVILSTHLVADVKALCPQMAILHQGKIILHGAPEQFLAQLEGKVFQKQITAAQLAQYQSQYQVLSDRRQHGKCIIHVFSETNLGEGFSLVKPSLEDVYFAELKRASDKENLKTILSESS